ncbi:uncharacterized protein LOC111861259 isoform X2 [Cryptotermes secundus]|uniref:uncharacterized protein LOC111861259 isoform X2 n=1 Tax=Cryptotermes secundus TaxID=105785 RepID=UPI000CD7D69E|nr:uncharacterized protein LOC111861259 isoform X2 [Cryptotermes secundus]
MLLFGSIHLPLPLIVVLASLVTAQQYPEQYQVHDDGDSSSAAVSSPRVPDFSKYYASETSPGGQKSAAAAEEAGFVRPIDFSALFGATNVGFGGDAAGSSQVFRPANSDLNNFALPLSNAASVFPAELEGSATTKNSDVGFTSPNVKFQSLFDASGSATEVGFRPQDFLKPPGGDKASEESSPATTSGFFSPSFAKLDGEYNVHPGPQYSHYALPAAAEQRPNKSAYRASSESEEEDSPTYAPATSKESYDEKKSYKASPTEEYSFKPTYKAKVPEYIEGKSSYAPSADKYVYRPIYGPPSQDRTSSSEAVKSAYVPSADYYTSKTNYRPSPSEHQQRSKPIYSSPPPLDIYGKSASYLPASTEQREEKPRYSSHVDPDVIYGKSLPPTYQPLSSEPHQGKSSYPVTYPTAVYNDKYISKPSPSSQSKFYSSTTIPFSTGKPSSLPNAKSATPTAGSPSNKQESYEDEPAGHGPPEYAPSGTATDKKKCKKINKKLTADDVAKGRFRRDAMTCYECEDPKTGGTFEQCAYSTEPNAKSYFVGHAQKYSTNSGTKPTSYRYRRYLSNDPYGLDEEGEELVAAESHSRVARQGYGYEYGASGSDGKKGDYHYDPEYFTSSSDDYTEYKPSGTNIDQKNCKTTKKDTMTCMVCKDPKTGGSYEQCSYTAEPKKNNYFVAHETSFNSGNKQPYTEKHSEYKYPHGSSSSDEPHSRQVRQEPSPRIKKEKLKKAIGKSNVNNKYDSPYEFSASTINRREAKEEKKGGVGLDPFLYGEPEPYDPKASEKEAEETEQQDSYFPGGKSYDEYFRHLFPELHDGGKESASSDSESYDYPSSANTKNEKTVTPGFEYKPSLPDYFTDNEQKKDLEKVLGEFTQKDRSACKKVVKDKMTCYKCVDSKGMQHEECMFVAASEPKSSHLAYHEVKEYRLVPPPGVPDGKGSPAASLPVAADSVSSSSSDITKTSDKSSTATDKVTKTVVTTTTPKPKRKTFFKKVTTSTSATPVADSKYGETSKVEILKVMQKPTKPLSSSSSSEKSPAVAVRLTRRSSRTSVHTTTTTLTTPEPPRKKRKLSKKAVKYDSVPAASETSEKKVPATKSSVIPPEPELSASDLSPDGYYSAETKTKFDPVLKVTLPEYMLTRSEHEAIFDEVMASGRRR